MEEVVNNSHSTGVSIIASIAIIITYIVLAVAVLAAIVLPLVYFIRNFDIKKATKITIILVGFFVLFLITYALSTGDLSILRNSVDITSVKLKITGAALITTYILTIGAISAAIYSAASGLFNKK